MLKKEYVYAIVLVAITTLVAIGLDYKFSKDQVVATVTDKSRVCNRDNECKYLIFTDVETFEVTDSLIHFRFNSSDYYGSIQRDQTYTFTVVGWRIPLMSMHRNIIDKE